jgi:hypothetical protein
LFFEGASTLWRWLIFWDCSLRSVTLLAGVLGRAGERGQRRRLADAEDGVISWTSPRDVDTFIEKDAMTKAEEELGQILQAKKDGTLEEKPLTNEDFMSDDELLRTLMDGPVGGPPQ